jgi:hypothetical protein
MNNWIRTLRLCALTLAMALATQVEAATEASLSARAWESFWWGDFAALEKQNALLGQPGHISADGNSELGLFRDGLDVVTLSGVADRESYLQELEKLTLQWATERPQSALAHILYARTLAAHGWSYRGTGSAREVPPQALEEFRAYLRLAADYLTKHAAVAMTDSSAHATLLDVGKGLGWDTQQLTAIAQEGLKRNPEDISLYADVMSTLLPQWGGDANKLDRYIRQVAKQTKAEHGMGMYFRLYSAAAEEEYGHALFQETGVDWAMMKQGFQDIQVRYPSPTRHSRYAYMACLAKDKEALLAALDKLGSAIDIAPWGPNPQRTFDGCVRWAKRGPVG